MSANRLLPGESSLPETTTDLTLTDLLMVYRRRSHIIYGTTLLIVALMAAYCILCTRRYEATGSIQIQRDNPGSVELGGIGRSNANDLSDSLSINLEVQTQAEILQSSSLALQTIKDLHLDSSSDFRPHWNPIGWVMGLMSPRGEADPTGGDLESSPSRRAHDLAVFKKNLKIKPVAGTRIISVSYLSSDRALSAKVVNTLIQSLLDYNFHNQYTATNTTSKWLSEQLATLRKQSEDLQSRVVNLQRESGVYSMGSVDSQGREQAYSAVIDELQQATTALASAEQNRILKEAVAKAAEAGNGEMLSSLAGNSIGPGANVNSSLTVIQNLRQQEASEQAALGEARAKYGPAYPKIAELEGNISGLQHAIDQESNRLKQRAQNDFIIARQTEQKTRDDYDHAKQRADVLNSKAIEFAIVRQEAEQSRSLYEDLLRRVNEAGVLAGLQSSNISVVDPGRTPARPAKPSVPLYMAGSLVGGWLIGLFAALLTDTLDRKINTVTDLERIHGGVLLGALPFDKKLSRGRTLHLPLEDDLQPSPAYIEVINSVRTHLFLSGDERPQVVLVTSAIAGEGKSTCAMTLAAISARSGKRTLIVDADLRRGTVGSRGNIPSSPGLSELLQGEIGAPPIYHIQHAGPLYAVPAGKPPVNPADLLASSTMLGWLDIWRREYDCVIIDSVPVLPVADAIVLNTLSDFTILLARRYMSEVAQIERSYSILQRGGQKHVGIVMNGLDPKDSVYYGHAEYGSVHSVLAKGA
ncbi:GumC family protein [Silvibacterium acidisoli]|uniref:GumC family protein n=1 Tax=Acidobacteriaceae bacterium ZG23-2 TaxID=2883246 RepID=UPI00406D0EB9